MKIGVDGGGTKTELILLDDSGDVASHQLAPGCNPSICGPEEARRILADALATLTSSIDASTVSHTLLCMAGNRGFWQETAATLSGCGEVEAVDDSVPALELATGGGPGLVLHAGTGSFVAARTDVNAHPLDALVYAGGLGWRFGDPGSGYDIGRQAIALGMLELQGWNPPSGLGPALQEHAGSSEAAEVSRFFYGHPEANRIVSAFAPIVLNLASAGDAAARGIVKESIGALLALGERVAKSIFPRRPLRSIRAGLSGPVLTHPAALASMAGRSALKLVPITRPPIDGVRLLLSRLPA